MSSDGVEANIAIDTSLDACLESPRLEISALMTEIPCYIERIDDGLSCGLAVILAFSGRATCGWTSDRRF
jgi:hypothetical protein